MPTGYTAGVQSGEVTDFATYAMGCARAFGALVTMRDDPPDAEIPEAFEPDDYYARSLKEAEAKLAELESASDAEIARMVAADYEEKMEHYRESVQKQQDQQARYDAMLEKARRYVAPTPDHEDFAKFLVSQLEESKDFDKWRLDEPEQLDPATWKAKELEERRLWVEMHRESWEKVTERCKQRTEWVRALRESLQEANS